MCNLCPSSCGLCLVCQDLPYVSPKTYNCTGAEITFEDGIPVEYCLHKTPMSFDEAEKFCQQDEVWIDYQGHLASISDALTNAVFLRNFKS
uniref:Uncharacterized protein n=1 Tax=Acrobeloides nanus TaxID=290746 RepID=A0A914DCE5_9BILA